MARFGDVKLDCVLSLSNLWNCLLYSLNHSIQCRPIYKLNDKKLYSFISFYVCTFVNQFYSIISPRNKQM